MAVRIEIIGVGGYVQIEGADMPRPVNHGAKLTVSEKVAEQLIADGVAKKAGGADEPELEPVEFDLATAPDEAVVAWVADPETTIDVVETAVGSDRKLAARALTAEQARGDAARSSLVKKLGAIATAP